jgi:CHASE2 domain-containing sensor protein
MRKLREFISKNFFFTRSRLLKAAVLGLVVGIFGLVISPFQFAMSLEEDTGLGLLFKLRGPVKPPTDIVVVSIDKQSSDKLMCILLSRVSLKMIIYLPSQSRKHRM